jgi:hypothetical protein
VCHWSMLLQPFLQSPAKSANKLIIDIQVYYNHKPHNESII